MDNRRFAVLSILELSPQASLYLMAFTMQLGMGIMAPVLPEVKLEFGVSATEVALVVSAFGFARLLLDLSVGLLLDRIRPFVLLLVGTFVIAVGAVLGSLSVVFPMVILARGLMGAGSAICMMTAQFSLSNIAAPNARGRLLGTYQAAALAGSSFSPVIGGAIALSAGWRASFGFTALSALLAFGSVVVTQPRAPAGSSNVKEASVHTLPETRGLTRSVLVTYVVMGAVTAVLHFHIGGFQNVVLPLIGGLRIGLDPATIGLALALGTVVRVFASLAGGTLSDRHGRRVVIIPSLAVMGLGVFAFNYADSLPTYLVTIVIMAVGRVGNSIPVTMILDQMPARLWGRAMGINRFVGDLGVVLAPLGLGWLIDNHGYGAAILATAGLVWSMALLVLLGAREEPRRHPVSASLQEDAAPRVTDAAWPTEKE